MNRSRMMALGLVIALTLPLLPALLLIDPYPWAAPYEELRLKK